MNEFVLRNLDQDTITRLAERAAGNRRPIEQEIVDLPQHAFGRSDTPDGRREAAARLAARACEIAAMTPAGAERTDSVSLIRQDRDR